MRFPGFEGEWEECTIKDFGRVVTGSTPPTSDNRYYENGIRLWASPADLRGDKYISETCTKLSEKGFAKTRVIPRGATMVTCIGSTIGKMGMASCEMSTNQQINSIIPNTQTDSQYLYYAIQARFPRYSQSIAVQAVPILSKSSFEQLKNFRPLLQEQRKVGSFLDLIDRRITIQNKIIEDLITLEKEIVNYVFKTLNTVYQPLSIISERVTTRNTNTLCNNVLTISARDGLISQLNFFNKSVASQNLSNYIFLKKGDFAYNKSYSADHPWGAIKHLEIYDEGVLSPLYFCFRPIKSHIDTDFLQLYFETDLWHKHISDISVEGARNHGLLNMSVGDFMALPVPVPELDTQREIVCSLKSFRNKKYNEMKYREFLLRQKTYLLSHLFL